MATGKVRGGQEARRPGPYLAMPLLDILYTGPGVRGLR
jgi:hypothetical protein